MLRGVPRSWTKRVPHTGKRTVCASFLLLLLAGTSGFVVGQDVDVSIESLHISWVEDETALDRPTLDLDQALVGDTIRVSATVKNLGALAVGQFYVDFFFTETISGEHGKIGSQAVIGLDAGEERRPVVTFDSSAFAPGLYIFSAEADPPQNLGETERCNNYAPLGDCAGALEQSADRYQLGLLQQGSHISELSLGAEFSICQMGSLTTDWVVEAHNVGTDAFSLLGSDLEVFGYYRESLEPPANGFTALLSSGGIPQQLSKFVSLSTPGDKGSVLITLDYSIFDSLFRQNSALGKAHLAQLRVSVNPVNGGTPQDLYLPSQFTLAQFYSEVDLWTFPARSQCLCDDYTDITAASVDPAVAGGLVFHVVTTSEGDRLHVLKVRTGEEKLDPWSSPSGASLSTPAASYDTTTQAYRVYVGADDGMVYALDGSDKDDGSFLVQSWVSTESTLVSGTAYVALTSDGSSLLVGSDSGVFLLDAITGEVLRSHTQFAVSTAPAYDAATQVLWIASDEVVYGIQPNGTSCAYDAFDRITTDLLFNSTSTALFFGTDTGLLYAIDPQSTGEECAIKEEEFTQAGLRSIVGMDLVSSNDDAVLYLTDDAGLMVRVEYDEGRGFDNFDESVRASEPNSIALAPAILPNRDSDDALAVFVSGQVRDGRTSRPILQGMERDLEDYEKVTAWGTSIDFLFRPEEQGNIPDVLLTPVVDASTSTLLVASSDGYLYAFDLSQFE
ncbi:CARDB domain-containing protein [Candidatus Bipolaricaulota bacterium]